MSRRPSFPLFTGDFLTGTNLMSSAAVGAYMRMLCNAWETGAIPDTPRALARAMHLGPEDPPFEQVWAEVRPKWHRSAAGWVNHRLEHTRQERDEFISRQRTLGLRGATVRYSQSGHSHSGHSPRGPKLPTPTPTPTPSPIPKEDPPVSSPVDLDLSGSQSKPTGEDAGVFARKKKK